MSIGTCRVAAHGVARANSPIQPGNTTSGRIVPEKNSDSTKARCSVPRESVIQKPDSATRYRSPKLTRMPSTSPSATAGQVIAPEGNLRSNTSDADEQRCATADQQLEHRAPEVHGQPPQHQVRRPIQVDRDLAAADPLA